MKDLLLFYYNEEIPDNFKEIHELCDLNMHLFVSSFIMEKHMRYYEQEFMKANAITMTQREKMGMVLCGVALYFEKLDDIYNSSTLFNLALPSSNIVALVGANKINLSNATMIANYNDMKQRCIEIIRHLFYNKNDTFLCIQKIFLDNILHEKDILTNTIKNEKDTYEAFIKCKNDTLDTIKHAIALATYTIDFDINTFYNGEELEKLL